MATQSASKRAQSAGSTGSTVEVDLPAEIFDAVTNIPLIHQVVVAQQAAARQGTHSTKTRGEVRGGGRKPYKQKGTGRARQGSTRAPQFAGGGVVHGPQPRNYDQRTPKKMKAAALRGALSDRARDGRIHVVEGFGLGAAPSTRTALAGLTALSDRSRFLVVLERTDAVTWLSLRNAPQVHIVAVDQLNTYDVVVSDDVVFTKGAFDAFVNGTASASERPASIVQAPAVDAVAEAEDEPAAKKAVAKKAAKKTSGPKVDAEKLADALSEGGESFAGAVEADADGNGPEGYEIKGNAQSMKFHAPGGRWYDATIAEFWFKTAADAEAAGFTEAGKSKAPESEEDAPASELASEQDNGAARLTKPTKEAK
jgi:large subunit ribosomal protein L4